MNSSPGVQEDGSDYAVGGAPGGSSGGARQGRSPGPNTGTSAPKSEGRQVAGAGAEASGAAAGRAVITLSSAPEADGALGIDIEFEPKYSKDVFAHSTAIAVLRLLEQHVGPIIAAAVDGQPVTLESDE